MATWHGTIAGAMSEASCDLALLAAKFKAGELDAAETRAKLALLQTIIADSSEALRRLAEQEADTDG